MRRAVRVWCGPHLFGNGDVARMTGVFQGYALPASNASEPGGFKMTVVETHLKTR